MPNELLVANKHGRAVRAPIVDTEAAKSFVGDGGFGLLYAMSGMAGRNSDLVQSKMGAASAYQLIPAVNRSINLRADAVQSLDWKLITASSKGKKKQVTLDDGDAAEAQTAFGQAMREAQKASRIALIEQIVYAHDLYGEVYVEPLGNRYRTTGLKWLNPLGVTVIVERGELVGFRWSPQNNDTQTCLFDADQIAYDKLFNPFDDFRGMGMVEVGIDTMNIARNLKRWLMSFFRNNARPGQVISPKADGEFSQSNRNILKTEVEMFAKGSDNAYSTLVLPIPMDVTPFEQPDINSFYAINAPLQSEIYTIFGVPEALAGDQGKTRYKQGGDIMQAFYTNTIIPLSRWVEDYMNFQVLPFFDLGDATFEFDLSEFDTASADDKLRADIATEKFEATLITRDEARVYAGDTPVGGDMGTAYYVPPTPVGLPAPPQIPGGEPAKPQLPTSAKPPVPASATPKPPSPTGQEKAITYLAPKQADARDELAAWERKASKGNALKSFVAEKTSKHVEAFIRGELEAIGACAEKALVRAVFEDARFIQDLVSTKDYADTEDDFVKEVEQIIADGQDGTSSAQALGGQMRSAVRRYGLVAMRDGFNAAGQNPESFDVDTLKAFRDWQDKQSGFVSKFVQEVTKQGITSDEVSDRARMWRNRTLESARELGVTLGDDSTMMKWVEDGTKDKCPDCLALDGQVHSMKAWNDAGLTPTSDATECKSYNCLCSLESTDDAESGGFLAGSDDDAAKSVKYSPDQPRDDHGRFGEGDGVVNTSNARPTPLRGALQREQFDSVLKDKGLNTQWKTAIKSYTESGYRPITGAQIRAFDGEDPSGFTGLAKDSYERGNLIEAGLKDLPAYDGEISRSLRLNNLSELQGIEGDGKPEVGSILQNKALSSYSASLPPNMSGYNRTILRVGNNSSGVSIEEMSDLRDEREVLVPSHTAYQIMGITHRSDLPSNDEFAVDMPNRDRNEIGYVIDLKEITR